jgi:hypothetical protein
MIRLTAPEPSALAQKSGQTSGQTQSGEFGIPIRKSPNSTEERGQSGPKTAMNGYLSPRAKGYIESRSALSALSAEAHISSSADILKPWCKR